MSAAALESRRQARWWIGVVVVLGLEAGLIFALNKESGATPSRSAPASSFHLLPPNQAAGLPVNDPTLFALPHRQGFSGGTWQEISQPPFARVEWLDDSKSNLLALPAAKIGTDFSNLLASAEESRFPIITMGEPEPVFPPEPPVKPVSTPSRFWIEGELATRKLLSGISPVDLLAFTNADLLANSTVQVVVDAHGNTLSAVLLPPGSGSGEADRLARHLAKFARFEPLQSPMTQGTMDSSPVTFGLLVFHWQTLPPSAASTASESK